MANRLFEVKIAKLVYDNVEYSPGMRIPFVVQKRGMILKQAKFGVDKRVINSLINTYRCI